MKCEEIKKLLTELLDGELPPEDAAAVEKHAAGCETCGAELGALRQMSALVKSLPKAAAPAGLAQKVTASLDQQIAAHKRAALMRWMHVGGWLSAAAALIIVIQLEPWGGSTTSTSTPKRHEVAAPVETANSPATPETEKEAGEGYYRPYGSAKKAERLEAPKEEAGKNGLPAVLALTYTCADAKTGRADVLRALKLADSKMIEADVKTAAANAIAARIPRDKLAGLVAALKLTLQPSPKPPKKAGFVKAPAKGALATKRGGAVRSLGVNNQDPGQRDEVPDVQPRPAAAGTGEITQQPGWQATQKKTAPSDAQETPPTITVNIMLKVK